MRSLHCRLPLHGDSNVEGVNSKGYHFAMKVNDECTGCTNCALVCPDGVITVYRAKVTTE